MSLEKSIADVFASARPVAAARVLEALPEDAVRELLHESGIAAASAVVQALTPVVASRCLSSSAPARAADIVRDLPLDRTADLLRRLGQDERAAILAHVPSDTRRPLERLLRFPEHTAGAMMEPRVASFPQSSTVDATLSKVRDRGSELRYYVFIVDDELVLVGVTSLRELVSAPRDATLQSIMTRPVQSLSARSGRSATLEHPGWRRYPVLPVVDDTGRLVGVFRYETFRSLQEQPELEQASPVEVALALGELFWLGASGMLRGLEAPSSSEHGPRPEREET